MSEVLVELLETLWRSWVNGFDYPITRVFYVKDAIFDENRFSSAPRPSLGILRGTKDIGGSVVSEVVTEEDDPKTFDEAMKSHDVAFWKESINDEMDSIMGNNTWVLVDLPLGCKPLVYKWVFKRKLKEDETIEKFKARLMDVKTAFLNGYFDEEAPKQWNQKFDEVVLSSGYLINQPEKCVYSKFDETGKGVIICLYVDGMLIFGTNQVQVDLTKEFSSSRFSMKDMGEADVILGIRIKHESNGITIYHSHYIEKVSDMPFAQSLLRTMLDCTMEVLVKHDENMRHENVVHWTEHEVRPPDM
uniref:Reverse transcriptase Ty1/copia-type domain-containing protein n=1 Tax=Tanacetum cinerariifolium TaxID=118510 RepID=A0A6L2NF71_TANCI|nr:hypothetical protein [Tanacetum cinerariifolium]